MVLVLLGCSNSSVYSICTVRIRLNSFVEATLPSHLFHLYGSAGIITGPGSDKKAESYSLKQEFGEKMKMKKYKVSWISLST
jgi:hypothetical protein